MLSSPRLAALSRPFGSFFRSHFWLSGLDDIQEQLGIGATLLFSLGSVWLEICSTGLFLDAFGLRALAWVYGAIALLALLRHFIVVHLPTTKFTTQLTTKLPRQFNAPRFLTQPQHSWRRWQGLWLLPLVVLLLTPLPEAATLDSLSHHTLAISPFPLSQVSLHQVSLGQFPLGHLKIGLIQLGALCLRQQRITSRSKFKTNPAVPAGSWIQLLGSAIAAAALLCLLPILKSNHLDLHTGIHAACVILFTATLLNSQLPPGDASAPSGDASAQAIPDHLQQNANTTRYHTAQQSRASDLSNLSDSILGLRLRQSGKVFMALFGIAQLLGCLTEIKLFKQFLGLATPESAVSGLGPHSLSFVLCWLYIMIGFGGFTLQTLIDRRVFRRYGAFMALSILPLSLLGFSLMGLSGLMSPSRWTLWIVPALYGIWQATLLPDAQKKLLSFLPIQTQHSIQHHRDTGVALAWGVAGLALFFLGSTISSPVLWLLLGSSAILACGTIVLLRLHYVKLLIATVAEGRLQASQFSAPHTDGQRHPTMDQSPLLTRAIIQALKASLRSPIQLLQAQQSIQLLAQVDLAKACEILMPLLPSLPPSLQLASLSVLQQQPDTAHETSLRHLLTPVTSPEVYAAALKYLLQIAPPSSAQSLMQYLKSDVQVPIRAVAAAYMMAHGDSSTQRSASLAFVHMLGRDSEVERLVGAEALKDAGDLERLQQYITPLLNDFSLPVRAALLEAIAQTQTRSLYNHLLQALHSPLTQEIARTALQTMGDEGLQLLQKHSHTPNLPLDDKLRTWDTLAQLHTAAQQSGGSQPSMQTQTNRPNRPTQPTSPPQGNPRKRRENSRKPSTTNALNILALELTQSSGVARQHLLKLLLQQPRRDGIRAVQQILGKRTGIMALLQEELWLLGHLYGALVDLAPKNLDAKNVTPSAEVRVFRDALIEQQRNVGERVLLLLQFLYPGKSMKLAARKLRDRHSVPQGLAILERLLDPEIKPRVQAVFEAQSASKKLAQLKRWVAYEPLPGQQRLRALLSLSPGLDDWPHACAFHLAYQRQWRVSDDQLLHGLNHPNPAVQEAAKSYLGDISSGTLDRLLPRD